MVRMWTGFILTAAVISTVSSACPDTWVRHGSSCYAFFNTPLTFLEAVKECDALGDSNLAEIETKSESDYIKAELGRRKSDSVWIGGTDMLVEGSWVWDKTGEPFVFSDWNIGEPTQTGPGHEEDCLTMWQHYSYQWGDYDCSHKLGFVCEMPNQ